MSRISSARTQRAWKWSGFRLSAGFLVIPAEPKLPGLAERRVRRLGLGRGRRGRFGFVGEGEAGEGEEKRSEEAGHRRSRVGGSVVHDTLRRQHRPEWPRIGRT